MKNQKGNGPKAYCVESLLTAYERNEDLLRAIIDLGVGCADCQSKSRAECNRLSRDILKAQQVIQMSLYMMINEKNPCLATRVAREW